MKNYDVYCTFYANSSLSMYLITSSNGNCSIPERQKVCENFSKSFFKIVFTCAVYWYVNYYSQSYYEISIHFCTHIFCWCTSMHIFCVCFSMYIPCVYDYMYILCTDLYAFIIFSRNFKVGGNFVHTKNIPMIMNELFWQTNFSA